VKLYTLKESTKILQVSKETIYRLAQSGRLKGSKIGRSWRFSAEEIERYVEDRAHQERGPSFSIPTTQLIESNRRNKFLETRVAKLEEELSEAFRTKELAEEVAKQKNSFLANMSHEIRTRMNAVIGMLELLSDTPLNQEQAELTSTALQSAGALLTNLYDIIDFSNLETGRHHLSIVRFNIHKFISELEPLYCAAEYGNKITFINNLGDASQVDLIGDPQRLRQVLGNLIANASKLTPEEVDVTVSIDLLEKQGNVYEIGFSIANSSKFFSRENLDAFIETDFKNNTAGNQNYVNANLGLVSSSELVQRMGGRIEVQHKDGVGTTFYFTARFKIADSHEFPELQKIEISQTTRKKLRILVADDNQINRKLTKSLLEKFGYEVQTVDNGRQAVALVQSEKFDVILMDIQMPILGGIEATQEIRNLPTKNKIPIIALTANALEGDREEYLAQGLNSYVSKPIAISELLNAIERLTEP
jgi:excisionase family DNA binding protein